MEPKAPGAAGGGARTWAGSVERSRQARAPGQGRGEGPGGAARGAEGLRRRQQGRGYSHEFLTLWSW